MGVYPGKKYKGQVNAKAAGSPVKITSLPKWIPKVHRADFISDSGICTTDSRDHVWFQK
jgi:hypothetical protein